MNHFLHGEQPYPFDFEQELNASKARPGTRIGATLIDAFALLIVFIPLYIYVYFQQLIAFANETEFVYSERLVLFTILYSFVVLVLFQCVIPVVSKGRTVGKMVLGVKMVTNRWEEPKAIQFFVRSLPYAIFPLTQLIDGFGELASFALTLFWVASLYRVFTEPYGRAVHDQWSKVYVVYDRKIFPSIKGQKQQTKPTNVEDFRLNL